MKRFPLALLAVATAFAITPAVASASVIVYRVPEGGSDLLYLVMAGAPCCGAIYLRYRSRFPGRR